MLLPSFFDALRSAPNPHVPQPSVLGLNFNPQTHIHSFYFLPPSSPSPSLFSLSVSVSYSPLYKEEIANEKIRSIAGGCVFAGSYDGNVYCLNASSGVEIWRRAAGVRSLIGSGGAGSPVVADGVVYVVGNGVLSAWSSPSSGDPTSSDDSTFPCVEATAVVILVIIATATGAYIYSKRKRIEKSAIRD